MMTTLVTMLASAVAAAAISIVPNPVSVKYEGEGAKVNKDTGRPEVVTAIDTKLGEEEYVLDSRNGKVVITAGSQTGVFWGEQTLRQILEQSPEKVPGMLVKDKPAFAYRGAHFDCCRHFFTVEEVKEFIDIIALHKINVFHWHLTDDQGWRAEIKKYPLLTEVGAYRGASHYGSWYTQDQMREVVKYAAERHITVIPEIEMPGHALAALTAYPNLGCIGKGYAVTEEWGVFKDVFCIGKEETIQFLQDVLAEICEIFPSEYIHIGGDEAPRDRWRECPDCQKRMKEEGLKTEAELQSYLVRRIEKFLNDRGRKIIGWDEILEGGVSKTATVMSWRGPQGGIAASKLGNDVIMAPNSHYYLDYYQTSDPKRFEPAGTVYPSYLPLRKCYSFKPLEGLNKTEAAHIKGVQANTWCEHICKMSHVEHMVLPRLAALAEVSWSNDNRTTYENFVERCRKALLPIYVKNCWNYADYAFRTPAVE